MYNKLMASPMVIEEGEIILPGYYFKTAPVVSFNGGHIMIPGARRESAQDLVVTVEDSQPICVCNKAYKFFRPFYTSKEQLIEERQKYQWGNVIKNNGVFIGGGFVCLLFPVMEIVNSFITKNKISWESVVFDPIGTTCGPLFGFAAFTLSMAGYIVANSVKHIWDTRILDGDIKRWDNHVLQNN